MEMGDARRAELLEAANEAAHVIARHWDNDDIRTLGKMLSAAMEHWVLYGKTSLYLSTMVRAEMRQNTEWDALAESAANVQKVQTEFIHALLNAIRSYEKEIKR